MTQLINRLAIGSILPNWRDNCNPAVIGLYIASESKARHLRQSPPPRRSHYLGCHIDPLLYKDLHFLHSLLIFTYFIMTGKWVSKFGDLHLTHYRTKERHSPPGYSLHPQKSHWRPRQLHLFGRWHQVP